MALVLVIGQHLDTKLDLIHCELSLGHRCLSASEKVVVTCLPITEEVEAISWKQHLLLGKANRSRPEREIPLFLRLMPKNNNNKDTDVFQKLQWRRSGR